MAKEQESKSVVTRAEKKDGAKKIILELLAKSANKSTALIDEAAKVYTAKFGGEENENPNDVKGRIGSVLDVMKKDGEVQFDGGMYSLNAEKPQENPKAKRTVKKKAETKEEPVKEEVKEVKAEEKPKAKRTAKKKTEVKEEPAKEEVKEVKAEEKPKAKRTAKKKTEVKEEPVKEEVKEVKAEERAEETPAPAPAPVEPAPTPAPAVETEVKAEEKKEEKQAPKETTVMDMSFLFGEVKPKKEEQKRLPEREEPKRLPEKSEVASTAETPKEEPKKQIVKTKLTPPTAKTESVPQPLPQKENKPAPVQKPQKTVTRTAFNATRNKPKTADEKLREAFLSRLHRLGGDYFEYYSVYLLEKYSRRNGRRLEGLKISGGDHDGGIDGEIELTDRLGFRETIYIQAKNWDPDKGDERLWTVGETLLQQFIGACVCRQAKDGKQHCRGIFITTSRFTPEAKRILEETSNKFVGYDGTDLFETAKECEFGIIRKNGEWALDENLLSGERALFHIL